MASQDSEKKSKELVASWVVSPSPEMGDDVKRAVRVLLRRQVGEILLKEGVWAPIDIKRLTRDRLRTLDVQGDSQKHVLLARTIREIASEVLLDDEPKDVTLWLRLWGEGDADNARYVEEQLFRAIEVDLRHRINRILRKSNFVGMNYKIDQAELVSELYLKLKRNGLSRLPENRLQFYSYAEMAIESILIAMQKAALRKKRPPTQRKEQLLDIFPDGRQSQDPLQVLLDAEDPGAHAANRLRLAKHCKDLPPRQQKVLLLQRNGVSVAETAETLGISEATVKRDRSNAWAQLTKTLSAPRTVAAPK